MNYGLVDEALGKGADAKKLLGRSLDYFRADFERRFEKVADLPDPICVDKREIA